MDSMPMKVPLDGQAVNRPVRRVQARASPESFDSIRAI